MLNSFANFHALLILISLLEATLFNLNQNAVEHFWNKIDQKTLKPFPYALNVGLFKYVCRVFTLVLQFIVPKTISKVLFGSHH